MKHGRLGAAMGCVFLVAGLSAQASSHVGALGADDLRAAGLSRVREGTPIMDFELESLSGGKVRLSSLDGSVVLLNFWATWCPPCRDEMPSIERLANRYAGRGLRVLAVDLQEGKRLVEAFVKEFALTFTVLLDTDGEVGYRYGTRGLPTTYLISRDGMVVAGRIGGQDWDTAPVRALVEKLLAQ